MQKMDKTVHSWRPNPVEPHNFTEALDALFNLTVVLRHDGIVDEEASKSLVRIAGKLQTTALDHGEWLYQQAGLNRFYRTLNLEGLNKFVDQLEVEEETRRDVMRRGLAWADSLCNKYVGRTPFAEWRSSDEAIDAACLEGYKLVATRQYLQQGYEMQDLFFL